MLPAYDLIPILARLTGQSESTVETFYRRLNEAELIPRSAGRSRTPIFARHVVIWLLAILADVPSRSAADAARQYFDLRNRVGTTTAGAMLTLFIESLGNTMDCVNGGMPLDEDYPRGIELLTALHASRSRVEIDCGSEPRIRIIADLNGEGDVAEILYGPQDRPWTDDSVRKSYTVPGSVFVEIAKALYPNISKEI
jgi:hypothetical protein